MYALDLGGCLVERAIGATSDCCVVDFHDDKTAPLRSRDLGIVVQLSDHCRGAGVIGPDSLDRHGRKVLTHSKGVRRSTEHVDELEPALGIASRREHTGRRPPQGGARRTGHEPLGPPAEEIAMNPSISECLQRFERLPHRQVDDHQRVIEDPDIRGVATVGLQPPDEAR